MGQNLTSTIERVTIAVIASGRKNIFTKIRSESCGCGLYRSGVMVIPLTRYYGNWGLAMVWNGGDNENYMGQFSINDFDTYQDCG